MQADPFGNLANWSMVLAIIDKLAQKGKLSECQPGLIRILRHKGNWQLREEVLKRAGEIKNPSSELLNQILEIIDDDNIYYDARILAGDSLIHMLKNTCNRLDGKTRTAARRIAERLRATPSPPIFYNTLTQLYTEICLLER